MDPTALFFDLETIPNPEVLQHLDFSPLDNIPTETPASEIKDDPYAVVDGTVGFVETFLEAVKPDAEFIGRLMEAELQGKNRKGIFETIKRHEAGGAKILADHDKRRKLLSTTPEYCRIVAIGWAVGDEEPRGDVMDGLDADDPLCTDEEEIVLLKHFWSVAENCNPLVGYNIHHFDLKVILARSCILDVHPTRTIDLGWNSREVVDLMRIRFGNQLPPPGSPGKLKTLCKLYGIPIPAGDVDGSQVEALFYDDPGQLLEYVVSDVTVTRTLFRRWRGYFLKE